MVPNAHVTEMKGRNLLPVTLNSVYYVQVLYIIDFLTEVNFIIPALSQDWQIIFFFRSLTKEKFLDAK